MNNELKSIEKTIGSMEVAEMVEKNHKDLMRDIRRYCEQLGERNIALSDFFAESTYINSQNKTLPCYNITKKGCEFIAHKLTGIKGTEFTARYINRFHDMEDKLQQTQPLEQLSPQLQFMINMELKQKEQDQKISEIQETALRQEKIIEDIKNTLFSEEDDSRRWVAKTIGAIASSPSFDGISNKYQRTWNESYRRLVEKTNVNLESMVDFAKEQAKKGGASKTTIKNINKQKIIAENEFLRRTYLSVLKEMMIAYCVEVV